MLKAKILYTSDNTLVEWIPKLLVCNISMEKQLQYGKLPTTLRATYNMCHPSGILFFNFCGENSGFYFFCNFFQFFENGSAYCSTFAYCSMFAYFSNRFKTLNLQYFFFQYSRDKFTSYSLPERGHPHERNSWSFQLSSSCD